jgi:hypothetical protein
MRSSSSTDVVATVGPVQKCVEFGFALEVCIEAYSIFASSAESEDVIVQNMLAFIMDAG